MHRRVHLRYEGTDSALVVPFGDAAALQGAFEAAYRQRFAFLMAERRLIVEAVSVEAVGAADAPAEPRHDVAASGAPDAAATVRLFSEGRWHDAALVEREAARPGHEIVGPAIVAERNATTVVEPGWRARVTALDHLVLERVVPRATRVAVGTSVDPVLLEVFNNLFMNIAEQMGLQLQNTAYSVNIKERLDFSCALFDAEGNLIANAPHMPVHLGSMSESIKTVRHAQRRPHAARRRVRAQRPLPRRHPSARRHRGDAGLPRRPRRRGAADVLRRLARPPRRHRRHDAGLDAALLDADRGRRRPARQREAGRGRPLPRGRDAPAAGGRRAGRRATPTRTWPT